MARPKIPIMKSWFRYCNPCTDP